MLHIITLFFKIIRVFETNGWYCFMQYFYVFCYAIQGWAGRERSSSKGENLQLQKLMKRNKLLAFSGAIFLLLLLMSMEVVSGQTVYKDPEDYESEQFIPVLDIWVNVSASLTLQQSQLNSLNSLNLEQQWELRHYWIVPDNDKIEWQVFDPDLRIVKGFLGQAIHDENSKKSWFSFDFVKSSSAAGVQDSDPGYEGFDFRDIDTVNDFANAEILAGDTGAIIDIDPSQIDDATAPTNVNYTFPDLQTDGVLYWADDSKSAEQYGKDMAEKDGVTFYNLVNASAVGFAYEDTYEDLDSVVWAFDEESTGITLNALPDSSSSGQQLNGFTLKRYRIPLHQMQKKITSFGGKVTKTIKNSEFKKIGSSVISASPVGAKFHFSKKIGDAFTGLKMKVGSLASGIFKSLTNIIIAVVTGLVLILIIGIIFKIVF